jgi:RNA polymerase sigma-70 factor (ECF subfamily)
VGSDAHAGDRALVAECVADAPGAWARLVDRCGGAVAGAVRRVLGGQAAEADVDDCCAAVMHALLADDRRLLRSYRGDAAITTWLYIVARRTALAWKARAERHARPLDPTAMPAAVDALRGPAWHAQRRELAERIRSVLEELPERDRTILRQFYLEARRGPEIAAGLGIPADQISTALHRARERARKLLQSKEL